MLFRFVYPWWGGFSLFLFYPIARGMSVCYIYWFGWLVGWLHGRLWCIYGIRGTALDVEILLVRCGGVGSFVVWCSYVCLLCSGFWACWCYSGSSDQIRSYQLSVHAVLSYSVFCQRKTRQFRYNSQVSCFIHSFTLPDTILDPLGFSALPKVCMYLTLEAKKNPDKSCRRSWQGC